MNPSVVKPHSSLPNGQYLLAGSFTIPGPDGPVTTNLIRLRDTLAVLSSAIISELQFQLHWKILDPTFAYKVDASDDFNTWTTVQTTAPGATDITHTEPRRDKRFFRITHE